MLLVLIIIVILLTFRVYTILSYGTYPVINPDPTMFLVKNEIAHRIGVRAFLDNMLTCA